MFVKVMTKSERDEHKKKTKYKEYLKILTKFGQVSYLNKESKEAFLDETMDTKRFSTNHFWLFS